MKIALVFLGVLGLVYCVAVDEQDLEAAELLEAIDFIDAASVVAEVEDAVIPDDEARAWKCLPKHSTCDDDCQCCDGLHCHCPLRNLAPSILRCSCQSKDGHANTCKTI